MKIKHILLALCLAVSSLSYTFLSDHIEFKTAWANSASSKMSISVKMQLKLADGVTYDSKTKFISIGNLEPIKLAKLDNGEYHLVGTEDRARFMIEKEQIYLISNGPMIQYYDPYSAGSAGLVSLSQDELGSVSYSENSKAKSLTSYQEISKNKLQPSVLKSEIACRDVMGVSAYNTYGKDCQFLLGMPLDQDGDLNQSVQLSF